MQNQTAIIPADNVPSKNIEIGIKSLRQAGLQPKNTHKKRHRGENNQNHIEVHDDQIVRMATNPMTDCIRLVFHVIN